MVQASSLIQRQTSFISFFFIKDAVNMAAVHKVASIKVLLNANAEELEKEKNAVNVTLEKGCLHMISSHNSDDLFNILNVELSFDKWLSLHVQALPLDVQAPLHDLQQTFKLYPSPESVVPWKVQVEEFLLSLPLFNTAYNDFWWIFDLQEQREQREQPAPDSIKESLGMPLIQENQYLVDTYAYMLRVVVLWTADKQVDRNF
jgi:hypothetical protein